MSSRPNCEDILSCIGGVSGKLGCGLEHKTCWRQRSPPPSSLNLISSGASSLHIIFYDNSYIINGLVCEIKDLIGERE